ncbi:hypothetical protein ACFSFY_12140 [Sporosarcina siberiensis]|uniref:Uncharacterized protein n=1 Tax=Sporosarcina siberiensis TaxID=1365606 RepID=A0ABW4SGY5_9BACL
MSHRYIFIIYEKGNGYAIGSAKTIVKNGDVEDESYIEVDDCRLHSEQQKATTQLK